MITIRLEFPAGRYHATPHGRHVNEGVPEWPPSPYRLLRALFDVWQRKCADLPQTDVESVLAALAKAPPRFHLPFATASHTRSYLSANALDPSDKNLVFDAFLTFDRDAVCYVSWPELNLSERQTQTLGSLLHNLNYLGRSESWVCADLDASGLSDVQCDPLTVAEGGGETAQVACAIGPAEYSGRKRWLEALTASTTEVAKQRASAPPLLRSVRYLRPEKCIETDPVSKPRRKEPLVEAVLLALDSTVLPLATETIAIAEQVRCRLMGAHKKSMGDPSRVSPLFSGKGRDGQKRMDHGHLYILPLANERSRIDRILLISKLHPWEREELNAVQGVRMLYQRDDRPDVRCAVAWQGRPGELSRICTRAKVVESATPFVAPRHWRRGRDLSDFLKSEIRRECLNHGLPEPIDVAFRDRIAGGIFECVEYRRNRKDDPVRPGYALRLEFANEVMTPFAVGYGAHFGLGMFRAGS